MKQLLHSRLLDMILIKANSAQRSSLAIHNLSYIQRALMK